MAHPYVIYKLPVTRRQYNVREPTTSPSNDDESCSICYRTFHEKDDPADENEIPCAPIELRPCAHVVGSECFAKMVQAGMDCCQVCRTKVELLSNPFPDWLQTATSWSWFRLYSDYTPGHALQAGKLETFDALSRRLFDKRLPRKETFPLWWFYMDSLSAWTRIVLIFAVLIRTTFAASEWFLGTPFVELQLFRLVGVRLPDSRLLALWVDFPIMAALWAFTAREQTAGGSRSSPSGSGFAMLFIMARMFALLFSIKGFALLLALNWTVYGVLTALLIWHGTKEEGEH